MGNKNFSLAEEKALLLENEWYLIRDSGELPEIAYHAALYQLCKAPDGPRIKLSEQQRQRLLEAALLRFVDILLRDLNFSERNASASRGLRRAIINYQRFCTFCKRQQLDTTQVRMQVRAELEQFFAEVLTENAVKVNCSKAELEKFACELGVTCSDIIFGKLIFTERLL